MNREFKEGDRVAVYHRHQRIVGVVDSVRDTGELRVIEDGFYKVHEESPFHPKQCRHLKPIARREWWLEFERHGVLAALYHERPGIIEDGYTLVNVREVRKAVKK